MKSEMNRREFIRLVAASGAVTMAGSVLSGCATEKKHLTGSGWITDSKPNFVIIICDDQGYADVGCYGAEGFETPNLDKMASEGVRFTDFLSAGPTCTASRAALMTGCYPQRISMPGVLGPHATTGISSQEKTIADILKEQGYATACYGKWHLGHHPEFLPMRHGFDDYFGLPYSNDMWPYSYTDNHPDLPLIEGEKIIEYNPDQTKLTTWYTERSVKFIEKNKDRPFFLYLPHTMAHVPLFVSRKFRGKSKKGLYGDVIMELDWSVGQILSTLKRLGIDENTFVMFTSDNGPWLVYGNHGGCARPLREGKITTFEGGQRVPCIMRWPGKIPAGSICTEMVTMMDILPTITKLAGGNLPSKKIDGNDIRPLIEGQPRAKSPHETFFYYLGNRLQAVRCGKWKLHFPHSYQDVEVPGVDGFPGKSFKPETRIDLSLFDLEKDVSEQHNVADEHPDVVRRLMALADEMREELGDSEKKMKGKNRRPAGHI